MKTKKKYEFKIGEIVVYPKHGVGEISKIENLEVANIKANFYVVKMEQSKLIRRLAGLLYISDVDSGNAKQRALDKNQK